MKEKRRLERYGTQVKTDWILLLDKLKRLKDDCKEAYIEVTGRVSRSESEGMAKCQAHLEAYKADKFWRDQRKADLFILEEIGGFSNGQKTNL